MFSWCLWLFCFLNTKILHISLMTWELVPDQNFFASEFMTICDDFQFSVTWLSNSYSVSKLKYRKLSSYFHLLILLSGDIILNLRPTHQHKLQCLNKWNTFKSRGLHFIHFNINSLPPKIEELRIIAKSTNATILGISESKLDESVLEPEIQTGDDKILRCDRNRQGGGLVCYIRNDLSYNVISVFFMWKRKRLLWNLFI